MFLRYLKVKLQNIYSRHIYTTKEPIKLQNISAGRNRIFWNDCTIAIYFVHKKIWLPVSPEREYSSSSEQAETKPFKALGGIQDQFYGRM